MAESAHRFRLFVSAGADLEAEHEAIGRAVAQIPIPSLGWAIRRTPPRGQPQFVAWDDIAAADFCAHLYNLLNHINRPRITKSVAPAFRSAISEI